ncbi:MAG: sulfatase-like hydrolase/transferase [Bryobacteraceae bacterium]
MALPSTQTRVSVRDFLLCLSIGNLLFLRRWYDIETIQSPAMDYYRPGPAQHTLFWATLAGIAIIGVILWLASRLIRRNPTGHIVTIGRVTFMLLMMVSLETIRRFWNYRLHNVDWGSTLSMFGMEAVLAWGIVQLFRNKLRVMHAAERVALFMVVAIPAFAGHYWFTREIADPPSAWAPRPSLPMLPAKKDGSSAAQRRVIWLLFDEFDQRLAFDARQPGVELPELDRIRAESLVADHAEQTANFTMLAVPSLIAGRSFERSESVDESTLLVTPPGSSMSVNWHDQPNVFRKAHEMGFNAGIVGWHHPYCRVLGDSVASCFDMPSVAVGNSLARDLQATNRGFVRAIELTFHLGWLTFTDMFQMGGEAAEHDSEAFQQEQQQREYFQIRDRAYRDAVDPRLGLLYVHFPTPHLFAIYDAKRKDFTLSDKTTYFDNLALVDRTVRELRAKLEQAGLWDSTTLLISSDHGLRREIWKGSRNWSPKFDQLLESGSYPVVPFILKLAGQTQHVAFDPRFSAVVTGNLALSLLSGDVKTSQQAADWLLQHGEAKTLTAR